MLYTCVHVMCVMITSPMAKTDFRSQLLDIMKSLNQTQSAIFLLPYLP